MSRRCLIPLFVAFFCLALVTGEIVWADDTVTTPDGSIPYTQTPARILVDYTGDKSGNLTLTFTALPEIRACGRVGNMKMKHTFDSEAVDIELGDFKFYQPPQGQNTNCGAATKVSRVTLTLSAQDLEAHAVTRLRLWYGKTMDTFYLTRSGYALDLRPPVEPKFFDFSEQKKKEKGIYR